MSSDDLESVKLKRRDDRMFYIRIGIDCLIGICAFLVIRNLNAMDVAIQKDQETQEHQAAKIASMETTIAMQAEKISSQDKMLSEVRNQQEKTETRLENWLTKVSDKLNAVAEKVGAH